MAKTIERLPVPCRNCGYSHGFRYTAPADMAGKYQCIRCFQMQGQS